MTYDLRKELRNIDEFIDLDIVATKIRRLLKLVNVSAAHAFKQMYNELNGFKYEIDGGNSDIDDDSSLMEIQRYVTNKTSISFQYKITCDNGNASYCNLNSRTSREQYIRSMIEFINSRPLKNKLNITDMKFRSENGKNPRLHIQMRYAHKKMNAKGKIESKNTNLNFNFALKYAGSAADAKKLESLKPSNVTPSILDRWMTPDEMYNNVISFINSDNFPVSSPIIKKSYADAVTDSFNSPSLKDNLGIAPDLSSEFFEILSALKLGKLLSRNNAMIKEIVGYPDEPITRIELNIPEAANEALIDYKVAVNGERNNPLKISVKSKVRGSSTATVKFTTAFANEAEVHTWFKNLKFSRAKNYNIGQRMIAASSLEYKNYSGRGTLYPIRAVRKLFSSSKRSVIRADFNSIMNTSSMTIDDFYKVISVLDKKISSVSKNYEPLDNMISDEKMLLNAKNFIADNLFKEASKIKKLKESVLMTKEDAEKHSPNNKYTFTLNNIALLCERVLVRSSQRDSNSKFNFYKMFYDQVLKKEAVVYAVTKVDDSGSEEKLEYTFQSAKNFKQYKKWITLRTKNYANNLQDALGMAV
ncbi:hypothetical protein S-PM2d140 [Synechococcus phage S-PM2]|uniref:Hypothetical-Protein / belonging to T4-LIKE GC: 841 n=1 Tax=Synechococcus phage S-PM2 TaxID=238854 RepID=Q5GQJ7_BPSYP|nr:Hypothetical-Protein / belonging to T4-LIKE GC: 841 [Synechococcus phage S-PM2]CAF34205.1 Hypothetical-Protein / belonging to T4-LIKE GC: 841 [Synechococcus phage S-PM2]CFW42326.1 hypothetical protein S-PM2d140 [Synechococcus phage S-PM2]